MSPSKLVLTPAIWHATFEALSLYHARQVEGGCFWYGYRSDSIAEAITVGVPKQSNWPQRFEISSEALAELTERIGNELVVVAQIHSHPGAGTQHSPWDDQMIVSRRIYSLVIPFYASRPCDLASVGTHVHDGAKWLKLEWSESVRRLILTNTDLVNSHKVVVDAR